MEVHAACSADRLGASGASQHTRSSRVGTGSIGLHLRFSQANFRIVYFRISGSEVLILRLLQRSRSVCPTDPLSLPNGSAHVSGFSAGFRPREFRTVKGDAGVDKRCRCCRR